MFLHSIALVLNSSIFKKAPLNNLFLVGVYHKPIITCCLSSNIKSLFLHLSLLPTQYKKHRLLQEKSTILCAFYFPSDFEFIIRFKIVSFLLGSYCHWMITCISIIVGNIYRKKYFWTRLHAIDWNFWRCPCYTWNSVEKR